MVKDNALNRNISIMDLAKALQLESIKHQEAQKSLADGDLISPEEVGKCSDEIIACKTS